MRSTPPFLIAAVVATYHRPELLKRALHSISQQELTPDRVLVVDDSPVQSLQRQNQQIVREFSFEYLQNSRTKGLAGSHNTALARLESEGFCESFVAFLDDHDIWHPAHILDCLNAAWTDCLDMVATGLIRVDSRYPDGRRQRPPQKLDIDDLLIGNTHFQGSGLVVRLRCLLEAGLFDESLSRCTDRDLCIRLAELPDLRYGPTSNFTAIHRENDESPRLSTSGSPDKPKGLEGFWQKYRRRLTPEQMEIFTTRAHEYFQWTPLNTDTEPLPKSAVARHHPMPSEERKTSEFFQLLVAVIANPEQPDRVSGLLRDLNELRQDTTNANIEVLVLENGASPKLTTAPLLATFIDNGLRCQRISVEMQISDAEDGVFGAPFLRGTDRLPIATARTMLQVYAGVRAMTHPDTVIWLLDDDMRLAPIIRRGGLTWLRHQIAQAREKEIDAIVGSYVGDAPIPALLTMRTQLVDVTATLNALLQLTPDDVIPFSGSRITASQNDDRYHDASDKNLTNLEQPTFPSWLHAPEIENAHQAMDALNNAIRSLAAGATPMRQIANIEIENPIAASRQAKIRGGNTLVLTPKVLTSTPNSAPSFCGRPSRRSDTLWTLRAQQAGFQIVQAEIATRHVRTDTDIGALSEQKLVDDILGVATYQALVELRAALPNECQDLGAVFQRRLLARLTRCRQSLYRIDGLTKRLLVLQDKLLEFSHPTYIQTSEALELLRKQLRIFASNAFEALAQIHLPRASEDFLTWYHGLDHEVSLFRDASRASIATRFEELRRDELTHRTVEKPTLRRRKSPDWEAAE